MEKNNYAALCIENLERKYCEIDYELLHEVRINSFCRYRESKTSADYKYPLHVLDEVMENINKWVKTLSLGSTEESWVEHSSNMVYSRRCLNYCYETYRNARINFDIDANDDIERLELNHKKQKEPRKNLERIRVYELLLTMFGEEKERIHYSRLDAQNFIKKLEKN